MKPEIFTTDKHFTKNSKVLDCYSSALHELFIVRNPSKKNDKNIGKLQDFFSKNSRIKPIWIYYPWREIIVKTVPEKIFIELKTARNKNLITKKDQNILNGIRIGIIGMSIGSATLDILTRLSGSRSYKIADFDTVEITNLNRMNANLLEVGSNKADIAARRAYEIDPFLDLTVIKEPITEKNINKFLNEPKLDIVIDAMDSLDMKVILRKYCRDLAIPVVMGTTNGDSVIIDIERYDLDKGYKYFHGRLTDEFVDSLVKEKSKITENYNAWLELATKIVDPEILLPDMKSSVQSVGKKIAGVPQLAYSVYYIASNIAFITKEIFTKNSKISGRRHILFQEKKSYDSFTK